MIGYIAKKLYRDERLVQLLYILSILRGSPDRVMLRDQGYGHLPRFFDGDYGVNLRSDSVTPYEPYDKSMDAVLAHQEESLIRNLHSLNSFTTVAPQVDMQAYLLNAEPTTGSDVVVQQRPVESPDVFREAHEELTTEETASPQDFLEPDYYLPPFEELEFLEALWKQDVDIGIPREAFDEDEEFENDLEKINDILNMDKTKDQDPSADPSASLLDQLQDDKIWATGNFTIDSETGELLAKDTDSDAGTGSLNLDAAPSLTLDDSLNAGLDLEFNLDEALRLADLPSQDTSNATKVNDDACSDDSAFGEGSESPSSDLDALNASIDEMIQTPHFNSRNVQSRLGVLPRVGGSMDQRWQDLASFLSVSSPEAHHAQSPPTSSMAAHGTSPIHTHPHGPPVHHPHPLYPPHDGNVPPRSVLLHNATLPPPMSENSPHNITYSNSMGASSHLVTSSMNLTNNAELSVPGSDHSYKMENSSINSDMIYYQQQQQQSSAQEIGASNDGIWSSILNEEDLQLMDITMNDYNGRNNSEYNGGTYRYSGQDGPHRHPQKKQDIFTKRYFQENPNEASNNIVPNNTNINGTAVGNSSLVQGYQSHYPSSAGVTPMEGTALDPSELKYSCTMDFRSPTDVGATPLEHVQHNHTYHMSPEGPSGINRPITKDKKGKKSDSEKHLSRDEKKARALNLPISCDDIINLPMDEFNERISKFDLTEAQLSLIRDIRRRGKNKVAAQNCRKRKLDQITHLAEEVKVYQYRKTELRGQLEHYTSERARIKHKFSLLYRHIFNSLRDPDGNPYCPHEFSLQQSADGDILLVPRAAPHPSMDHISKNRSSKEEPSP